MTSPSHANQSHWDGDAANYHAEHPGYLSSFYWCPEMLHEALAGAQVEVSLGMLVLLEDDRSVSAQRHWALTDQGLLEVRVRPTDVEVVRVEPGAIGHELVWITTGALQVQSEGRRSA